MDQSKWLRSYVERVLQDNWDQCRVEIDGDGDYPFRYGTAACWVHIDDVSEPTLVRVFAHAARGIKGTVKALREINELNSSARAVTVSLRGECLLVSQAILAVTADHDALEHACKSVGSVADDIGAVMAAVYGGRTPYEPSCESADGECG